MSGNGDSRIVRRRLIAAVGRLPLTVICAPAGSGKSVLLQQVAAGGAALLIDGAQMQSVPYAPLLLVDNADHWRPERWLAVAAQQLASGGKIVFAARSVAPAVMSAWRPGGGLAEITFEHLCFTADELARFAPLQAARLGELTDGWPAAAACAAPVLESDGHTAAAVDDWLARQLPGFAPAAYEACVDLAPYTRLTRGALALAVPLPRESPPPDGLRWLGVPLLRRSGGWGLPAMMRRCLLQRSRQQVPEQLQERARTVLRLALQDPDAVPEWPWPADGADAACAFWFYGLRQISLHRLPVVPSNEAATDDALYRGAVAFAACERGAFAAAAADFRSAAAAAHGQPDLQLTAEWAGIRAALAAGELAPAAAMTAIEDCIVRAERLQLTQILTAAAAAGAGLLTAQGRGRQASALLEVAARVAPQADWLLALRCSLHYQANQLTELAQLLHDRPLPSVIDDAGVTIGVHHALLAAAEGDFEQAQTIIARLKVAALPAPLLIRESLAALEAELQLRAGRPTQAAEWLDSRPHLLEPAADPPTAKLQLSALRVCLAVGRFAQAEQLLTALQRNSAQIGVQHRRITLLLLSARLERSRGRPATELIDEAVRLAAECGLPRLVIDELPELAGRFSRADDADPTAQLSLRDRQLLRYLAGGCSNRDIAAALHLSEGTVKQYLVALYARLGVRNRAAAAAAAHRLQLLQDHH